MSKKLIFKITKVVGIRCYYTQSYPSQNDVSGIHIFVLCTMLRHKKSRQRSNDTKHFVYSCSYLMPKMLLFRVSKATVGQFRFRQLFGDILCTLTGNQNQSRQMYVTLIAIEHWECFGNISHKRELSQMEIRIEEEGYILSTALQAIEKN